MSLNPLRMSFGKYINCVISTNYNIPDFFTNKFKLIITIMKNNIDGYLFIYSTHFKVNKFTAPISLRKLRL